MNQPSQDPLEALRERLPAALERFFTTSRQIVVNRAIEDGFSSEEANWIELHSRETLLQRVADGATTEQALDESYRNGRRALAASVYEAALASGVGPAAAFHAVVLLEAQTFERLGEPEPYAPALILAGCETAAAAAAEGATVAQQIDTAFAMMRDLATTA
jgi:hypothetical protein